MVPLYCICTFKWSVRYQNPWCCCCISNPDFQLRSPTLQGFVLQRVLHLKPTHRRRYHRLLAPRATSKPVCTSLLSTLQPLSERQPAFVMNGFAPPFGQQPAPVWREHRAPSGRTYYVHSETNVTQWEKPEELIRTAEDVSTNALFDSP